MKEVTNKNIHYGELVELASLESNKSRSFTAGYHAGVKVHYFNERGVLVGNVYEFVEYKYLRKRCDSPAWPRYYMLNKRGEYRSKFSELILQKWFELKCRIITVLIRNTYKD